MKTCCSGMKLFNQWDETEEREYQPTVKEILQEASLPMASGHAVVSTIQFSQPVFGPSLVFPTFPTNVSEGTSVSVPQFDSPVQQTISSGFKGFNVPDGNPSFSRPIPMSMPYPGLDGHQRRITPIPVSNVPAQPSVPAVQKSPEQIQKETSDLIQKLDREKAEQEALAKMYKETNEAEKRKGWAQIAKRVLGAKFVEEEKSTGSTSPSSGTNRPTIGSTTISTHEAETIRE